MADDAGSRPAPDALLELACKEERGRLEIFLGAYPGVGKTYAMLEAAQERRREGADVAVGMVETHGRSETEVLLPGLEILLRWRLSHRGLMFAEMDLAALLRQKPQLAIVDELAHTNVPGARHVKRWQDVEELIAAGIDVHTSLLGFLAYNFVFTSPYSTFTVAGKQDVLTILFFLLVAVIVGNLAARLKVQVEAMRQVTRRTANLHDFSRRIAGAAALDDVLWAVVHHVAATLKAVRLPGPWR
ncbi:MAG: DUF4118 domain-containing protein [Alphaproteobacteria bacterium]